jgi:uncharacterized MAPEG superfamily protein
METAIICVFIASILPIAFAGTAKFLCGFKVKHNRDPRKLLAQSEGKAYFAKCAHDNSWEAFAPFAAGVILAMITGVNPSTFNPLCIAFVVFRILYGLAYIFDKPTLRSILWDAAFFSSASLYYLAWNT